MELKKERETFIDALKGIAILGVVMVHSGAAYLPGILGKVGGAGAKGVEIFLLITAYLTWKSLSNLGEGKRRWLLGRFFRIAPLYYVSIMVSLIVLGTGKRYWLGNLEGVSVWNVLSHLFFINGLNPFYSNSIIGGEWYIAAIALFYIMAVFLIKKLNSFTGSIAGVTAGSIGYFTLKTFSRQIDFGENNYIWRNFVDGFSILPAIPVLMLGVMLYYFCQSEVIAHWKESRILSYCIGIFSCYFLLCLITGECYLGGKYGVAITTEFLYGIGFMGLFISQKIKEWNMIDNKLFGVLGKYSYGIFLFHMIFIELYDKQIQSVTGNAAVDWFIKYVLIVIVTFGTAYLLENGTDRLIRKIRLHIEKEIRTQA